MWPSTIPTVCMNELTIVEPANLKSCLHSFQNQHFKQFIVVMDWPVPFFIICSGRWDRTGNGENGSRHARENSRRSQASRTVYHLRQPTSPAVGWTRPLRSETWPEPRHRPCVGPCWPDAPDALKNIALLRYQCAKEIVTSTSLA